MTLQIYKEENKSQYKVHKLGLHYTNGNIGTAPTRRQHWIVSKWTLTSAASRGHNLNSKLMNRPLGHVLREGLGGGLSSFPLLCQPLSSS